jgi:glucose dehydrogenase
MCAAMTVGDGMFLGRIPMKMQQLAVGLALLFSPAAMAQTADELAKGSAADISNVLNYGMGYDLHRFSPLKQINKDNVQAPGAGVELQLRR